VKEMEILEEGVTVWRGIVQKGSGSNIFESPTVVHLLGDEDNNKNIIETDINSPVENIQTNTLIENKKDDNSLFVKHDATKLFERIDVSERESLKQSQEMNKDKLSESIETQHITKKDSNEEDKEKDLTFSKPVSIPALSIGRRLSSAGIRSGTNSASNSAPNSAKATAKSNPDISVVQSGEHQISSTRSAEEQPAVRKSNILFDAYKKAKGNDLPLWLSPEEIEANKKEAAKMEDDLSDMDDLEEEVITEDVVPKRVLTSRSSSRSSSRDGSRPRPRSHSQATEQLIRNIDEETSSGDTSTVSENVGNQKSIRPRPISEERKISGLSSRRRLSRPMLNTVNSTSSSPSDPTDAAMSPVTALATPSSSHESSTGSNRPGTRDRSNTPRKRAAAIDQSYDSLLHFKFSHSGILKVRDDISLDDVESESDSSSSDEEIVTKYEPSKPINSRSESRTGRTSVKSKWKTNMDKPFTLAITAEEKADPSDSAAVKDEIFEIPINPNGRKLTINMKTSWGDPHYIGLSGIEIFNQLGRLVTLKDVSKQVKADPADINILPAYGKDPRTVDKLFDGVNRTCDDMHVWLAPFTPGKDHFIYVNFDDKTTLSMIRIWNYNKSRIHSYRGARFIEVLLDDNLIFKGEIQKASGTLAGAENFAECVLFTNDSIVLDTIEKYDAEKYEAIDEEESQVLNRLESFAMVRPSTASKESSLSISKKDLDEAFNPELHFKNLNPQERPTTSALTQKNFFSPQQQQQLSLDLRGMNNNKTSPDTIKCRKIRIDIESSWGDMYYSGLTGIEVLDEQMNVIPLKISQLNAVPRDMNAISGHSGDYRTLDKLIDGVNMTTDDSHMWLIPYTMYDNPHLTIDLVQPTSITGLRIYNYNKSLEDSFRGCKKIRISLDDKCISPDGHILRKAPGNTSFDFGHTILLSENKGLMGLDVHNSSVLNGGIQQAIMRAKASKKETPRQDYETALLPTGYVFKFHLLSTHGDPHYIGLNSLELYDAANKKIPLTMNNVHADPKSVQELGECRNDVRTLDKLIDGNNDTWNDRYMWLAPYAPGNMNYLYVIFEEPVAVSMIKIWNYSKTPERGVEEIELFVDDVLIYKGDLRKAPSLFEGVQHFSQSILFTNDPALYQQEKENIYRISNLEQMVMFINNDKKYLAGDKAQQTLYQQERKKVSSRNSTTSRPMTSVQSINN
jgi:hypothetical protein